MKFINVTSVVYQLPFGKGRRFGSAMNPVLDAVLGGWEFNTINTANTGNADRRILRSVRRKRRNRTYERLSRAGDAAAQRVRQSHRPEQGHDGEQLLCGVHVHDASGKRAIRELGRNAFRAPGLEKWDFAVNKSFRIRGGNALQFRSEFFNILNHTNFGIPTAVTTSAAFGTIRKYLSAAPDSIRAQTAVLISAGTTELKDSGA